MSLQPPTAIAVIVGLETRIKESLGRLGRYSENLRDVVGKMLIVDEEIRPDFRELAGMLNQEGPSPVLVRASSSDFPIIISETCSFCDETQEVFLLCHPVCVDCYRVEAGAQLLRGALPLRCRYCGSEYPAQLFSLLD